MVQIEVRNVRIQETLVQLEELFVLLVDNPWLLFTRTILRYLNMNTAMTIPKLPVGLIHWYREYVCPGTPMMLGKVHHVLQPIGFAKVISLLQTAKLYCRD
jgi:hypothetical protein